MKLQVDGARVVTELTKLATFSDAPSPAVTRVLFTDRDLEARAYLTSLFKEANLSVRQDAIGNLFARWGDPGQPGAVGTGSHTDAIPHSGMYDGTVGVIGGLEAIRSLQRAGFKPKKPVELLMFTSEEPTRFGLGCLGSRLLAGAVTNEKLASLKDKDGKSVDEARAEGHRTGPLSSVKLSPDYYAAFVELHIEQGPILEREHLDIGIVTAIAAPAALRVIFTGEGGHAGAVLMPVRKDALLGAAELALEVDRVARSAGSPDAVGTTGLLQVYPGACNSIPSKVTMELDIRDTDLASRDRSVDKVLAAAKEIAARRGLGVTTEILNADPPAKCDPRIIAAADHACSTLGFSKMHMVSRAYHDSLFMARLAPTGMIFIPCRAGVSHRPDEFSTPDQIAKGVSVLAHTLAELAA
jgi:ureidoglycolate amidohydrolase